MRNKKYSRLKLYIITTFLAFVVSSAITTFFLVKYNKEYFKVVIGYLNEQVPVNISIEDISIGFPLRIVLKDLKVYSKAEKTIDDKEFLSIPNSSIFFNPLKIATGRGIFYCISDVYVTDAYLYPNLIDANLFKSTNTNIKSESDIDVRKKVQGVLYYFEDKNIKVDNFNIDLIDKNGLENTKFALQYIRADLKGNNYTLDTAVFFEGQTDIKLSLNADKEMTHLESKLIINNKQHSVLDYYMDTSVETNNVLNVGIKNASNESIGYVKYDYNKQNLKFNITNATIKKENIYSVYEAISSIPMFKKLAMNSTVTNMIKDFTSTSVYMKGEIGSNRIVDFDISMDSTNEAYSFAFDVKITNDTVFSTNFYVHSKNAGMNVNFSFPIGDPLLINANAKISNMNVETNKFALDFTLRPRISNNKKVVSRLAVNNFDYKDSISKPILFDIEYLKQDNILNLKAVTNDTIKPLVTSIYLNKDNPLKVRVRGDIDNDMLRPLVGNNIVGTLNSSIEVDYSLYKTNSYVNNAVITLRKIYTEEILAKIDVSVFSNKVVLKDLYYAFGTNSIHSSFDATYTKNGEVDVKGNIITPLGSQKIEATLRNIENRKILNAYTEDKSVIAKGDISDSGKFNVSLETAESILFYDTAIDTKIYANNTTKPDGQYSIWGYIKAQKQKSAIFNLDIDFEVSNTALMFTNILYTYRDNSINGSASITSDNGIIKFSSNLKDTHSSGFLLLSFIINRDNIFGNIDVTDMPIAFGTGNRDIYGLVNSKATIVGMAAEPIIHINTLSIKEFEVSGYRFDISMTGSYKKEEINLQNIMITKTGSAGFVLSQSASKLEQIRIPNAYFSKDVHKASIEIVNMYLMSRIDTKIDYSMKKLFGGEYEYKLSTAPIKINKRKLPAFNTMVIYDKGNFLFKSIGSHGIDGSIINSNKNYFLDLQYMFDNKDFLDIYGDIKNTKTNQVDVMLTSRVINVEIFEIFNNLFTTIESSKTNFMVENKPYTLYARVHGDTDNLAVDGRFLGHGNKVKLSYFSDTFTDTEVDFLFEGHVLNIGSLNFYTKNRKWLKLTGEGEFVDNTISYMSFDILSSDEQIGLLTANADIDVLRSKGPAHVDLNMGGSISNPKLTGTVTLIKNDIQLTIMGGETLYTERVPGILSKQYFDLNIQALKNIRIAHNLVGDVYIENGSSMRVYGSKEEGIELQGTINFERGNIYYLQNIYNIERGYVTFPDIDSLDPIINATAYTYTKYIPPTITASINPNTDSYNVTLYMEMNTRVSQMLYNATSGSVPIRFYTIPTLGQSQVNQLAGIAASSSKEESHIYTENTFQANQYQDNALVSRLYQQQAIQSYSDLLIRNIALRPVERWVRQFIGIDYISFSSAAINNLLFREDGANSTFYSILDKTSVSIGKYASRDLYFKYDVVYRFNDPTRPTLLNKSQDPYYFEHQFGFEVSLLRDFSLANFLFEYKINPFDIRIIKQEFNVLLRWRLW